jgi:hypothetical protein
VHVPVGNVTGDYMGCYVFNVAQTFSYRYCLVNQMSLVAAASTATSNCDVFGLEFGCPSLVNHHKRIYITNMTTAAMHNNQAAFTNECQCTYDICGRFFNLAYENSMHGKISQPHQSRSHHKHGSFSVEFNCHHHKH